MEKWLIVYASNTGNTKRVAEAMFAALPEGSAIKDIRDVANGSFCEAYDVVVIGYWVTRGGPDARTKLLLPELKHKEVVLFQTLGAETGSEHAVTSLARAAHLVGEGCNILGTFSCRGKINPALLEKRKDLPPENPHHASEANLARWAAAAGHPNEADLESAKAFIGNMQRKLVTRKQYARKQAPDNA